MKAMLEPRIVAASIQSLACSAHGTRTLTERIIAAAQGGLMAAIDALVATTFQAQGGPSCQALPRLRRCFDKTRVKRPWVSPPFVPRDTLEGILRAPGRIRLLSDCNVCI